MAERRKLLFMTNSEAGQANVCLAVAYELLTKPNFDIHVASFGSLKPKVEKLKNGGFGPYPTTSSLTFHCLPGRSMSEALLTNFDLSDVSHPPGLRSISRAVQLMDILIPWTTQEYIEGMKSCVELIEKIQPDLCLVDVLLGQGRDAVSKMAQKHILLSPNSLKDLLKPKVRLMSVTRLPA